MKRFLPAIAGLCSLQAQVTTVMTSGTPTPTTYTYSVGNPATPSGWDGFLADLRTRPGGSLVVLGGTGPDLAAELARMLKEEPLLDFDPKLKVFAAGSAMGQELRDRHRWGPEARWICFSADGRVLDAGMAVPAKALDLAARLLAVGYRGPVQVLEAFLREHPDHLEARMKLLDQRMQLAQRRLQPFLNPAQGDQQALQRPLTGEEDRRLFGPVALELGRLLADPSWPHAMKAWRHLPGVPEKGSPTLQAAAWKFLPVVEAVLQRAPASNAPWSLWVLLSEWTEGRDILALLAGLKALPDSVIPPPAAQKVFVAQARARKDWSGIRTLLRHRWEGLRDRPYLPTPGKDPAVSAWDTVLADLLEADLRLGRGPEAEKILHQAQNKYRSPDLPKWAGDLAARLGQTDYAKAWRLLPLPPKSAEGPFLPPWRMQASRTLESLIENLPQYADQFLVLEDGSRFSNALKSTLREEPCVGWDLEVLEVSATGPTGSALRAREGWGTEPRWVLLGSDGKVKAQGIEVPSAWALAERLEAAGLRTLQPLIEAMLREDATRVDALAERFRAQFAIAEARMRPLLKEREHLPDGDRSVALPVKPLTEEDDRRIWGPASDALAALVAQPDFGLGITGWTTYGDAPERLSPTLRDTARRILPACERLLAKTPTHTSLWEVWMLVSGCIPDHDPTTFLADLHTLPDDRTFPPASVLSEIVAQLRAKGLWQPLRDLLLPRWAATRERVKFSQVQGDPLFMFWPQEISPLVEAMLKLGDRTGADRVVQEAMAWAPSKGLPARSSALARACGELGLAEQWANLPVPETGSAMPRK